MQIQTIQDIVKIRDRGQMTWPEEFRVIFSWLQTGSIVEIKADKFKEQLIVKPLIKKESAAAKRASYKQKLTISWPEIEKNLKKIRKMGNQKVNLTEFLIRDRDQRKYEF